MVPLPHNFPAGGRDSGCIVVVGGEERSGRALGGGKSANAVAYANVTTLEGYADGYFSRRPSSGPEPLRLGARCLGLRQHYWVRQRGHWGRTGQGPEMTGRQRLCRKKERTSVLARERRESGAARHGWPSSREVDGVEYRAVVGLAGPALIMLPGARAEG